MADFPDVGFCYATENGYLGRLQSKRLETNMLIGTFQLGTETKEVELGAFPYLGVTQVLCQDAYVPEPEPAPVAMDTDEFGGKRRRRRTPRGRKSRRKSLRQRK